MVNQEAALLLIDQLAEVIEERKIGYQKASQKIADPYLKALFQSHSDYCSVLMKEISSISSIHNDYTPKHDPGKWKYWFEMKSALKSGTRSALLEACIKGEQRLIDLYMVISKDANLDTFERQALVKQYYDIKKACDLLNIFKISL